MPAKILPYYNLDPHVPVQPYGSGLINHTWLVKASDDYILQRINHDVFKHPWHIADNIDLIAAYLKKNHPDYLFVAPVKTTDEKSMVHDAELGYFRMFPFVKDSYVHNVLQSPGEAYEAAAQFGGFTKLLSGLAVEELKITLPNFHNLVQRFHQFMCVCTYGNAQRIAQAAEEIRFLRTQEHIVTIYSTIVSSSNFRLRPTHHDTKISNVLFDAEGNGLCVIDLDTVMPGFFISDVGDMMRTYLSPVSEEEKDFSKITVREEYFEAIVEGYLSKMADELTEEELRHFVYAGKFMIYMQAIRFLADYFNNDAYYGARYKEHNYVRAKNQITLLKCLLEKEQLFNHFIKKAAVKYY